MRRVDVDADSGKFTDFMWQGTEGLEEKTVTAVDEKLLNGKAISLLIK
jgi:hypothetical protein